MRISVSNNTTPLSKWWWSFGLEEELCGIKEWQLNTTILSKVGCQYHSKKTDIQSVGRHMNIGNSPSKLC